MNRRSVGSFVGASVVAVIAQPAYVAAGPCACNSDVNNSAGTNVIDIAIVQDCARYGNCAGCVNSCDIDCDGDVDYYDTGVAACAFEGQTNCCSEPAGTCANTTQGPPGPECVVTTDNYCSVFAGTWYADPNRCVNNVLVPTVSTWGLLALALGTLIAATLVIQRRTMAEVAA